MRRDAQELLLVFLISLAVALVSPRPYAGGWNDGSRLAQVESLVDFRTLSIDRSIFVDPARTESDRATPYPPNRKDLMKRGTLDKVFVRGRFYSDKAPVPALFMAACYQVLQWTTGLKAGSRPDLFIYLMTLISSGFAYITAVLSIHLLGRRVLADRRAALAVTFSFALGSSALAYARQVNNHEFLLAVAAAIMLFMHSLLQRLDRTPSPRGWVAGIGLLAGLGYCLDLAAGPLLLIALVPLIACRCRTMPRRGVGMVVLFLLSALPLIILHHVLNYLTGGTLSPINTVLEYLSWPGSPFDFSSATGHWHHRSILHGIVYALELLVGKKGFVLHQPVLILAIIGGIAILIRYRPHIPEMPEILFSFAWSSAVWLIYAWGSTNASGVCATIRWFVPLLAPGYYVLMLVLRERPDLYRDFLALAAGGLVLSALMWYCGPWMKMVPGYWIILALTLLGWSVTAFYKSRLPACSDDPPGMD
jgi:hypothetical protein